MKVKNLVLGIGIVVIFALTLWQGIEAFYPSPQYDNYCNNDRISKPIPEIGKLNDPNLNYTYCIENNGTWMNGYCDYYYECQKEFNADLDEHSKIVFFVSLIVAVIVFITGYAILSVEPVGSALIGSGIWAIFYGTVINWRNLTSIWRFLLLLMALVIIVLIALRLNRQKQESRGWMFWKKKNKEED